MIFIISFEIFSYLFVDMLHKGLYWDEHLQAEIGLIVTLSAKFRMNWRMDQMLRLTHWLFIILAPNKGGSVEEITLYQIFEFL